jgi:hypothetical protein
MSSGSDSQNRTTVCLSSSESSSEGEDRRADNEPSTSGFESGEDELVSNEHGYARIVNYRYVNNYPELREEYGLDVIPDLEIRNLNLDILSPSYRPNNPMSVVFTLTQFKAGLRLPVSDLVVDLLNTIKRAPCQMNGNFWRNMRVIDLLNEKKGYKIRVADIIGHFSFKRSWKKELLGYNMQTKPGRCPLIYGPSSEHWWEEPRLFTGQVTSGLMFDYRSTNGAAERECL